MVVLVGNRVSAQLDAGEAAHRLDVVKGVFHGRIREAKPLLHEVDPEHLFKPDGRAAVSTRRIIGLNLTG